MRKSMKVLAGLCGVAAMMAAGVSFAAEGNASAGAKIFAEGKGDKGIAPCGSCHGDKGQGDDNMGAPRLAGQGTAYIVKQLNDFAKDKRVPQGTGAVMPVFAKGLSDEEIRDVAAYVHSLKGEELSDLKKLPAGYTAGESYKGQTIVKFGTDKVSACQSCHQYNGRGAAPMFPMIGRQKFVYLVNQLRNWRAEGNAADKADAAYAPRANDPEVSGVGIMRAVAKNLTDQDINDVATFLSSAEPTTEGNHQVPAQD